MNSELIEQIGGVFEAAPAGAVIAQSIAMFLYALLLVLAIALAIFASRMAATARRERLAAQEFARCTQEHLAEMRFLCEQVELSVARRHASAAGDGEAAAPRAAAEPVEESLARAHIEQTRIEQATKAAIPAPHHHPKRRD